MRELHDRLSEHLERVANGADVLITRRGRPIARLSAVDALDPLEELVRRGLVSHLPEGSAPNQEAGREGQGIGVGSRRRSAPLTLYFDTSALIKLVVQEEGSELAAQLWSTRHPAAASIVAYPEGRAALASARRAGRLTPTGYRTALEQWEATHGELHVIAIDDRLARHAGELAEKLSLRGYDAVHLASSLALGPDTTVITWDLELNRAAHMSGFAVAPAP